MNDAKQEEKSDFPKEWVEIVQFIKYMRDELPDGDIKFSDFVILFIHLTDG